MSSRTFSYKLVLLGKYFGIFPLLFEGESAVGKSSLVIRFAKDQFRENQESTIGAAFMTQSITLESGETIKYEIWDTAGQERYHSLAPMYYRGAQAAVVVYDITNPNSFEKAKNWVQELKRQGSAGIVIALIGNKVDLAEEARMVNYFDGERYAQDNGLLFLEASAKTGEHVAEIFEKIAVKLPKIDLSRQASSGGVRLQRDRESDVLGKCC